MIYQLNFGSEQHTPGLFICSFEVVVFVFSLLQHHVFHLLSSA